MDAQPKGRHYELPWRYNPRILTEHLGRQKYARATTAVGELVANALAAGATQVSVEIRLNEFETIDAVLVEDDGRGMTPEDLQSRFMEVGVPTGQQEPAQAFRLGRFGVGRLAVHRIGSRSDWSTTAAVAGDRKVRSRFTLRHGDSGNLVIDEEEADRSTPTGTRIEILAITDASAEAFAPGRLASDLLVQFCSYLLGNPGCRIVVQGELLDVKRMIDRAEVDQLPATARVPEPATVQHLLLDRPVENTRFPAQVLFSAEGRTIATTDLERPPSQRYLGIVECRYLDTLVTSSREGLIEMDEGFAELRARTLERVTDFSGRLAERERYRFIETARRQEFYPYRGTPSDSVAMVKQALYDVTLEKVNESANIESMTKRQQAIVFRLLHRALDNENLLEILNEVARLSDTDMEKFRRVLEYTTLDSIIKLSSEVTGRLAFLDVLHDLVYGATSKHLKERSQLHKILEPNCWLFGTKFHLAASDRSFREVVRRHRERAGLDPVPEEVVGEIDGVENIPDLFLAAGRDYPVEPKHHHVLVELKAPKVSIGPKEVQQVRKYADVILDSHDFDKSTTRWDLYVVSAKVNHEVERDRHLKDKPHGCVWEWPEMTVWAFEWSELITRAREELQLVRDHLQRKSKELSVSGYLRENFPEILAELEEKQGSSS